MPQITTSESSKIRTLTTSEPSKIQILVVDDEEDIVEMLQYHLEKEGYSVLTAESGEEALRKAEPDMHHPNIDLIILDIMIPKPDGYEVCKLLRSRADTEDIPIIFLSAKVDAADQLKGFQVRGDDYIPKPAHIPLLLARAAAVLRRSGIEKSKTLEIGNLIIFEDEYWASLHGDDLGLTLTEFELLRYLVRHTRKAFTRKQLLQTIWKDAMMVTERTVDAHIKNLREKLGEFAPHVQTVRGVGYRFIPDKSELPAKDKSDLPAGDSSRYTPEIARAYRVLELEPGAAWSAVVQAYRELAKALHPDKAPDADDRRAKEIHLGKVNDAYGLLEKQQHQTE